MASFGHGNISSGARIPQTKWPNYAWVIRCDRNINISCVLAAFLQSSFGFTGSRNGLVVDVIGTFGLLVLKI